MSASVSESSAAIAAASVCACAVCTACSSERRDDARASRGVAWEVKERARARVCVFVCVCACVCALRVAACTSERKGNSEG